MLLIALSCLLMPWLSWMFVKLFTPVPPVHVQFVAHATVLPLRLVRCAHCDPDVAPSLPHWSSRSEYGAACTTSHWPQCEDVSSARGTSAAGEAETRVAARRRRENVLENMIATVESWGMGVPVGNPAERVLRNRWTRCFYTSPGKGEIQT